MTNEYTSDSIKTYEGLSAVRNRPTQYIPALDVGGFIHMIWEYISNSVDEIILKSTGTITIGILRNIPANEVQIVVSDEGRGIPSASVVKSFTKLNTSGKFNGSAAYVASAGQFGVGAKLAPALSTHFKAISKNVREKNTVVLSVANGEKITSVTEKDNTINGVTVIFQPDMAQFFSQATDFIVTGYVDLVSLCRKINIFNDSINFRIFLADKLFPYHVWQDDVKTTFALIESYYNKSQILYDSSAVGDKADYLFELWRTNSSVILHDVLQKTPVDNNDKLGFDIRVFFTKRSAYGNTQYFVTINNAELADVTRNSATVVFLEVLREFISEHLENDNLKDFVKDGEYTFPTLYLAIGIMYDGAQLGGTTKSTFRDDVFAKQFRSDLKKLFAAKSAEAITQFIENILPDIQDRYNAQHGVPKKAEANKLLAELNFRKNYYECRITGDEKSELFIVEGTSAGNILSTRDANYQAVYMTRGKPRNAASYLKKISEDRQELLKDPIYADIIRLMNIKPDSKDISSKLFNKIIIATDADPDGYHIRSLHLHNLFIINPLIITSGMLWLSDPPLYSMQINNKHLFLRDKYAMMDAKIFYIYKEAFALTIVVDTPKGKMEIPATDDLFRDTIYIINELGSRVSSAAKQLDIPEIIMERLIYALPYLIPVVKPKELCKMFASCDAKGFVDATYNPTGNYIVVSIGKEDYPIGLDDVGNIIRQYILPVAKKFRYTDILYRIKGKTRNTAIKEEILASPMQVYRLMQNLDDSKLLKIFRYKGLGTMPMDSCYETITNPATRSITQVINIGDIESNYALIGKDTNMRKSLLFDGGATTASFLQKQQSEI